MAGETGELDAEIAGQKISLKNVALNTMATFVTLVGVVLIVYMLYDHQQSSRDAAKLFVDAVKEQTLAVKESTITQREQNCLLQFEQKERILQADNCRRNAR